MEDNMSQMNKLDQRQQLMVVTMEECGELVQSSVLRYYEDKNCTQTPSMYKISKTK